MSNLKTWRVFYFDKSAILIDIAEYTSVNQPIKKAEKNKPAECDIIGYKIVLPEDVSRETVIDNNSRSSHPDSIRKVHVYIGDGNVPLKTIEKVIHNHVTMGKYVYYNNQSYAAKLHRDADGFIDGYFIKI